MDGIEWVDGDATPERPKLTVTYTGEGDRVRDQLESPQKGMLDADEIDVSFRLVEDSDEADAPGVLAVAGRLTGEFVLEAHADADHLHRFVQAARRYGETEAAEGGLYELVVRTSETTIVRYPKEILLVYNNTGDLLRDWSLIPGGVEL